jgi:hypothetical protein
MKTLEEIKSEYVNVCVKAGDLQYKIYHFSQELKAANKQLQALNQQALQLQQEQDKAKFDAAKVVPNV